jgi:hypothetical protein
MALAAEADVHAMLAARHRRERYRIGAVEVVAHVARRQAALVVLGLRRQRRAPRDTLAPVEIARLYRELEAFAQRYFHIAQVSTHLCVCHRLSVDSTNGNISKKKKKTDSVALLFDATAARRAPSPNSDIIDSFTIVYMMIVDTM